MNELLLLHICKEKDKDLRNRMASYNYLTKFIPSLYAPTADKIVNFLK